MYVNSTNTDEMWSISPALQSLEKQLINKLSEMKLAIMKKIQIIFKTLNIIK
jgi:hypothetical protein